jgi:XTP/dITP diphosphohydrolase
MNRIILASSNAGKLREFRQLFAPLAIELVPQQELGIGDADEPHLTFVENALAKARHAAREGRLPAMADDSGICVPALGGAPGVHSARYAGEPRSDERNNQRLIEAMTGRSDRRAHYYCVIVLVRSADDPEPLIAEGRWQGEIVSAPLGEGGFGYDPYFYLPSAGCTAAQMSAEAKNRVSHRAIALQRLLAALRESPIG